MQKNITLDLRWIEHQNTEHWTLRTLTHRTSNISNMTLVFQDRTSNRQDRTSNFYRHQSGVNFWPKFGVQFFFQTEKLFITKCQILLQLNIDKSECSISKIEKDFFFFLCNSYWRQIGSLYWSPNVRNVRRTLGSNFEHFRTSQFSPKPNFEHPEHPKNPNSSRTSNSSIHL